MQNHVSDFIENQKHVLCEIKTLWFKWFQRCSESGFRFRVLWLLSKSWSWIKRIEDRAWSNLNHAFSIIKRIEDRAWSNLNHLFSIRELEHARSSIRLIQDHDFDINYKTRNRNPDSETRFGFRIKKCAPEITFGCQWHSCCSLFSFLSCRSLFVFLFFLFWPLHFLSFDLRLIVSLWYLNIYFMTCYWIKG